MADGLSSIWDVDHFTVKCTDLWEERTTHPSLRQNHTYTVAACANGLQMAYDMTGYEGHLKCADEMIEYLDSWDGDIYPVRMGKLTDMRIDASLMGLAWPHNVLDKKRVKKTVDTIETELSIDGGIVRYLGDEYDGWQDGAQTIKSGAGTWPLLSLWMSLAQNALGRKAKAKRHLDHVRENFNHNIPEQFFTNDMQVSVTPLAWAHSLYVCLCQNL